MFKKYTYLLCLLALSGLLYACGDTEDDTKTTDSTQSAPDSTLVVHDDNAPQQKCGEDADYTVVFTSSWSGDSHGTDYPGNPHFSGLIGLTHKTDVSFWQVGVLASAGTVLMAETGAKTGLLTEYTQAVSDKNGENILSGGGINPVPGKTSSLEFAISPEFPLVTLASMIAPSPDWFVGVSGLTLCQQGQWVTELTVPVVGYDAGSDNGTTYTAANEATDPFESISILQGAYFGASGTDAAPFGTFKFALVP